MTKLDFGLGLVLLSATQLPGLAATDSTNARRLMENYGRSTVVFEQNVGQAPQGTDFLGRGLFHALSLKANGATLTRTTDSQPGIKLTLLDANASAQSAGMDRAAGHVNYMLGTDRSRWMLNVPVFQNVRYKQVWPGIDVVYYGTQSRLEYDFVVSAGADLNAIRLQFSGARSLHVNTAGDLVLETADGSMEQRRPHIYQQKNGRMADLDGHYVLEGNTVRFAVAGYDRSRELVIDPVLIYGKSAVSDRQTATAVALDSLGNSYYVGQLSQVFADKTTQLVGYVSKLDPTGATTNYSATTFGGRNQPTSATAVAVDSSNNVYIAGTTGLDGYFGAGEGFQSHLAGGTDAYLLKLDPDLKAVYSTYLGGAGNETAKAVAVDGNRAYVVGQTLSSDFPATAGLGPAFHDNSSSMGFAVAIDTTAGANGKLWATLLGGSGTDSANGVVSNGDGVITIGGSTSSSDFQPASSLGFSPTKTNGTNLDGFVVVLGPEGKNPSYFTYWPYGPIQGIAGLGSTIYATGATNGNIATTSSAFKLSPSGSSDAFVTKLNIAASSLDSLLYSSYLGGSGDDAGYGISVDSQGNAYIVGRTSSADYHTTAGSIPLPSRNAAPYGFLSVVNTTASGSNGLVFSTLLSANSASEGVTATGRANAVSTEAVHSAIASGVGVDAFGNVVVAATGSGAPSSAQQFAFAGAALPTATLSPTSGGGPSQSFTITLTDANGYTDIAGAGIVINSTLSGVNACYVLFARPDQISLVDDTGNPVAGHVTTTSLGAPAVLQNSQCVILASQTTQIGAGNTVQLTLTVVFKAAFAGAKNIWVNVNNNGGQTSGFQQLGAYTPTGPTQSLAATSVSPASGSGQAQAFTFSYFDPFGAPDISGARLVFNSAFTLANGCYLQFDSANNISLASDDGNSLVGSAKMGKQTSLQNSQCIVFPGNSYQTQIGQTLTVTVFVAFKPSFAGTKNIYSDVQNNAGTRSAFPTLGTYTVAASVPLSVNSVSPAAATGPSNLFKFVYADPNGYTDIANTLVIINPSSSTTNSCAVTFNRSAGTIALNADNGSGGTSAILGQATALTNSQCIVNVAASSQFGFGNYLTLSLFVTMKSNGTKNIYSSVTSNAPATAGPTQLGNWVVSSPALMTPVSVSPFTGAGPVNNGQSFTFTLSDPVGSNDISGALVVMYPSLQGASACYILWGHANNLVSLASDNAQTFTSATAGTAGLLSNSQCTVDTSQSFATETGNTVNLTLFVSFKSVYQQFAQLYSWVNVQNKASQLSGWSLLSRYSVEAVSLSPLIQPIVVPSASVGRNLQTSITVSLQTLTACSPASATCQPVGPGGQLVIADATTHQPVISPAPAPTGGLTVSVTSSDPTKLLVSGAAGCNGPPAVCGAQQIKFVIPEGLSSASGVYLHSLASSGTATITASASGFPSGQATINLTPSGFLLNGPNGATTITTQAGAANTPLTVTAVRLDATNKFAEFQQLRGGYNDPINGPFDDSKGTVSGFPFANLSGLYTAVVNVNSSNGSVGTVVTPATFAGGDNTDIAQFKPLSPGTTTLAAVPPTGFVTPTAGTTVAVTVNPPQPSCAPVSVGKNLATTLTCNLQGGTPTAGLPVTITSSDPAKFLLAPLGSGQTSCSVAGASTITINTVNASQSGTLIVIPAFCVYGVGSSGSATYSVSLSGFSSANGTVNLGPSGFVIAGPGGLGVNFTPFQSTTPITVSSALLDASLNYVAVQPLAAGQSANVTVSSSNATAGTLSPTTLPFAAGASTASTTFTTGSGGTSILSVAAPSGFSAPANYSSVSAVVVGKNFSLSCDAPNGTFIGLNLEMNCSVGIASAQATATVVTLTSNTPASLILSTSGTTAGSTSIQVTIPAGSTQATFFAQSLASSGTATYTASAPSYTANTRIGTIVLTPSGIVIGGPFGVGTPFFFANISKGPVTLTANTAALITDAATCGSVTPPCYGATEALRGGLASVQVSLTMSPNGLATLTSPVTIVAGSSQANATFTPQVQGQVVVSVTQPAGFTTPTNDKSLTTTIAQ